MERIYGDFLKIPSIKTKNTTPNTSIEYKQVIQNNNVYLFYWEVDNKNNNKLLNYGTIASRGINESNFKIDPKLNTSIFDTKQVNEELNSRNVKTLLDNSLKNNPVDDNGKPVDKNDPRIQAALLIPKQDVADLNSMEVPPARGADPTKDFISPDGTKIEFGTVVYPENISKDQDFIQFNILRYNTRSISTTNLFTWDPRYDAKKSIEKLVDKNNKPLMINAMIRLPIQSGISDSNGVEWSHDTMNIFELAAAGVSGSLIEGDVGITDLIDGLMTEAKDNDEKKILEGLQKGMLAWLARKASNPGSNAESFMTRISGAIYNPNLELLFIGPQLRTFNFTFRLTPRSEKEGKIVRKIIRIFKQTSAVQRGVGDIFLKAPYIYSITYGHKERVHPSINRIKLCALQNMSVNYIPDGTYMTYTDSTMTCYELSLSFTELEPVYADDYQNVPELNKYGVQDYEIGF